MLHAEHNKVKQITALFTFPKNGVAGCKLYIFAEVRMQVTSNEKWFRDVQIPSWAGSEGETEVAFISLEQP